MNTLSILTMVSLLAVVAYAIYIFGRPRKSHMK